MNTINTTTIQQLTRGQGVNALARLTGATIVYDDAKNIIRLVFKRQVGRKGKKLTHLEIAYNTGTDLYDIKAYKLNKKTFECPMVAGVTDNYAEDLTDNCEYLTDLCLIF